MKLKKTHEFVKSIVEICSKKVREAEERKLPEDLVSYEEGRLYEARYILDGIEEIIYEEKDI